MDYLLKLILKKKLKKKMEDIFLYMDIKKELQDFEINEKKQKAIIKYYKKIFKSITNLKVFQMLMTDALIGHIRTPFYGFRDHSEADTIDEYGFKMIVTMNKLGFLTDDSQVGKGIPNTDDDSDVQRSYVSGFLPKKFITKGLHYENFIFFKTSLLEREKSGHDNDSKLYLTGFYTKLPLQIHSDIHNLAEDLSDELWKQMIDYYDYVFMCDSVWGNRANGPDGLFSKIINHLKLFYDKESLEYLQ
jgi:hypothetical protein